MVHKYFILFLLSLAVLFRLGETAFPSTSGGHPSGYIATEDIVGVFNHSDIVVVGNRSDIIVVGNRLSQRIGEVVVPAPSPADDENPCDPEVLMDAEHLITSKGG